MRTSLLGVLLLAGTAWPCSGPTCESQFGPVPRAGSKIPANAPALGIQFAQYSSSMWDGGTIPVPRGMTYGLSRPDGGVIATTRLDFTHETWLELDAGLAEGDTLLFTVDAGAFCPTGGLVTLGPAAAIPTTAATISILDTQLHLHGDAGFCGGPEGLVQHAQLEVQLSSELEPWQALARWELEVDGANFATDGFGAVSALPRLGTPAEFGFQPIDTFHVRCPNAQPMHQVRLLARIVGVPQAIASNTLTVFLDCQPPAADAGAALDGGADPDPDAGTDAGLVAGADAGEPIVLDGGALNAGHPLGPASGCGVIPLGPSLTALLCLAALARRR